MYFFFFQAEDGIRDYKVTGVQTCALPICLSVDLSSGLPSPFELHNAGGGIGREGRAARGARAVRAERFVKRQVGSRPCDLEHPGSASVAFRGRVREGDRSAR